MTSGRVLEVGSTGRARVVQAFQYRMRASYLLPLLAQACCGTTNGRNVEALAPTASESAPRGECRLDRGFAGTVAGHDVTLRLQRTADGAVVGRYAHRDVGIDVSLRGTLSPEGHIVLEEGPATARIGHFDGTCDAGGLLTGQWTAHRAAAPSSPTMGSFTLHRVDARSTPLVVQKRFVRERAEQGRTPDGEPGRCLYEESWFEIFGAPTPELERRLNERGPEDVRPLISSPRDLQGVETCSSAFSISFSTTLEAWGDGFANVTRVGSGSSRGRSFVAAGYEAYTVDLRTGARVRARDVLPELPDETLNRCVREFNGARGLGLDSRTMSLEHVVLTDEGVRLYAIYEGPAASLTGDGPVLAWGALLRDGLLDRESAFSRAWAGARPAAKDARLCIALPPRK